MQSLLEICEDGMGPRPGRRLGDRGTYPAGVGSMADNLEEEGQLVLESSEN
jgi:hypothetical protein